MPTCCASVVHRKETSFQGHFSDFKTTPLIERCTVSASNFLRGSSSSTSCCLQQLSDPSLTCSSRQQRKDDRRNGSPPTDQPYNMSTAFPHSLCAKRSYLFLSVAKKHFWNFIFHTMRFSSGFLLFGRAEHQ